MSDDRKSFGMQAERVAERYLLQHGYQILERNVRYPMGELDLVAMQGETLVFCEVKARRGGETQDPAESIHVKKQSRLVRLATKYLHNHPHFSDTLCRYDAVLVWNKGSSWWVKIIEDAFQPGW